MLFTKSHEWVRQAIGHNHFMLGVTKYAVKALGDISFISVSMNASPFNRGGTTKEDYRY